MHNKYIFPAVLLITSLGSVGYSSSKNNGTAHQELKVGKLSSTCSFSAGNSGEMDYSETANTFTSKNNKAAKIQVTWREMSNVVITNDKSISESEGGGTTPDMIGSINWNNLSMGDKNPSESDSGWAVTIDLGTDSVQGSETVTLDTILTMADGFQPVSNGTYFTSYTITCNE